MDGQKAKEFDDLRIHYGYHRGNSGRDQWGKKIRLPSFSGCMTNLGIIEESEWIKQAEELIKEYGEHDILEILKQPKYHFAFMDESEIYKRALDLHIGRIFERTEWVQYDEFRKDYLLQGNNDIIEYLLSAISS